ncbi:MAG: Re/Si-specific NAD(P)(+) transhydrogenase subunit alpha [Elusimicrobiales bacterium]|nr:Re/Si-specific NAD(P)(+) transhydrogenase subunit alpha [Elusimicrobiales bacterium]
MKIAVPKEVRVNEARVAASPDTVRKYAAMGFEVAVETGAGEKSCFTDEAYRAAGAVVAPSAEAALEDADIILKVQRPMTAEEGANEFASYKKGAALIAMLNALTDGKTVAACAGAGVTAFAMELMPRISRAQTMDVLSSQSNLAGFRAVIDACYEYCHAMPLLMTAAGTVPAAHVCVMGAGVAGLQAIATARRLGAVVSAFDVRPAVKEQVQSLGAKFVEVAPEAVKDAETAGGYAKEMSEEYKELQRKVITEHLKKQDIVICTALIPGKKAPTLVTEEMVKGMKPGSVIVDMAVEQGGNCEVSQAGKVAVKYGVKIVGHYNIPSRIAADCSALYSKNLLRFVTELFDAKAKSLNINMANEVIAGTLVTKDGRTVHPALAAKSSETSGGGK